MQAPPEEAAALRTCTGQAPVRLVAASPRRRPTAVTVSLERAVGSVASPAPLTPPAATAVARQDAVVARLALALGEGAKRAPVARRQQADAVGPHTRAVPRAAGVLLQPRAPPVASDVPEEPTAAQEGGRAEPFGTTAEGRQGQVAGAPTAAAPEIQPTTAAARTRPIATTLVDAAVHVPDGTPPNPLPGVTCSVPTARLPLAQAWRPTAARPATTPAKVLPVRRRAVIALVVILTR